MGECALMQICWGALATFATGVMAVGAALLVGYRQTEILAGQNKLKENEIKVSLLERRLNLIDKFSAVAGSIQTAVHPSEFDKINNLHEYIKEARLVFSEKSIIVDLDKAHKTAVEAAQAAQKLDHWKYSPDSEQYKKASEDVLEFKHNLNYLFPTVIDRLIDYARVDLD